MAEEVPPVPIPTEAQLNYLFDTMVRVAAILIRQNQSLPIGPPGVNYSNSALDDLREKFLELFPKGD